MPFPGTKAAGMPHGLSQVRDGASVGWQSFRFDHFFRAGDSMTWRQTAVQHVQQGTYKQYLGASLPPPADGCPGQPWPFSVLGGIKFPSFCFNVENAPRTRRKLAPAASISAGDRNHDLPIRVPSIHPVAGNATQELKRDRRALKACRWTSGKRVAPGGCCCTPALTIGRGWYLVQ